jgi:hypothetical protein
MSIAGLIELRRIFGQNAVHADRFYYFVYFQPKDKNPHNSNFGGGFALEEEPENILDRYRFYFEDIEINYRSGKDPVLFWSAQKPNELRLILHPDDAEKPKFVKKLRSMGVFDADDLHVIPSSHLVLDPVSLQAEILRTLNDLGETDWEITHKSEGAFYRTKESIHSPAGVAYFMGQALGIDSHIPDGPGILTLDVECIKEEHLLALRRLNQGEYPIRGYLNLLVSVIQDEPKVPQLF